MRLVGFLAALSIARWHDAYVVRLLQRGGMTAFRKSALFYAVLQLAFVGYWAAYAWGNRYR